MKRLFVCYRTPAHLVMNLAVLGRGDGRRYAWAIILGSLIPDLPMFAFYFVEKVIFRTSEKIIWLQAYFNPTWQTCFDLFNSLPIICLGLIVGWYEKSRVLAYLFGSMLLHVAFDFPFHHDDAHRHFFPLWNWEFESPVSYWDPMHWGFVFTSLEALAFFACCYVLYRRYESRTARIALVTLILIYIAYFVFALFYWA